MLLSLKAWSKPILLCVISWVDGYAVEDLMKYIYVDGMPLSKSSWQTLWKELLGEAPNFLKNLLGGQSDKFLRQRMLEVLQNLVSILILVVSMVKHWAKWFMGVDADKSWEQLIDARNLVGDKIGEAIEKDAEIYAIFYDKLLKYVLPAGTAYMVYIATAVCVIIYQHREFLMKRVKMALEGQSTFAKVTVGVVAAAAMGLVFKGIQRMLM